MSKSVLKGTIEAFARLEPPETAARLDVALRLIEALPQPKDLDALTFATPGSPQSASGSTAALATHLARLSDFLREVGAKKAAQAALSAFVEFLDRHKALDIGVLIERATSEARPRSSRGNSSGRKMDNKPSTASALAERLGDFSSSSADAERLLAELGGRTVPKETVLQVAKQLTGRSFDTKKDAVAALKRWRWQWARTRSISKAIASGA